MSNFIIGMLIGLGMAMFMMVACATLMFLMTRFTESIEPILSYDRDAESAVLGVLLGAAVVTAPAVYTLCQVLKARYVA